jgi:hypothetical protein
MEYDENRLNILDTYISGEEKLILCYGDDIRDYIVKQYDKGKHYKDMDIIGELDFNSCNWMDCYDQFISVIKNHKKLQSQRTIVLNGDELKLHGYKMVKSVSIDPAIYSFLKDNKINISSFIQTSILEKLDRDNQS